jgi:hypothetical protein
VLYGEKQPALTAPRQVDRSIERGRQKHDLKYQNDKQKQPIRRTKCHTRKFLTRRGSILQGCQGRTYYYARTYGPNCGYLPMLCTSTWMEGQEAKNTVRLKLSELPITEQQLFERHRLSMSLENVRARTLPSLVS